MRLRYLPLIYFNSKPVHVSSGLLLIIIRRINSVQTEIGIANAARSSQTT